MSVRLASQVELEGPLKGYRLLERLGRGGFGEVWKVEAPGGLMKAMKFVFGDLDRTDDDHSSCQPAEQELRALNRVKSIRHPYILSLERIDRIDGQLIIVMELADRNLWDRFRECRGLGYTGIPREELLRYMEETAEALDLMNKNYHIQHLDVKPQNLFLVHNHVKVADFGLAKSFEGNRGTVTGGVTPVYAAPETFEGYASLHTDQYSLAIVFQELLTGTRPFNGSNVKQLLMQHLNGIPDLSPLPEADRAIIGMSLCKKPDERWPSCTEMVRSLRQAAMAVAAPAGATTIEQNSPASRVKQTVPASLLPAKTPPPQSRIETGKDPGRKSGILAPPPNRPASRTPYPSGAGALPKLVTPHLLSPKSRPTNRAGGAGYSEIQTTKLSALGLAPPLLEGNGILFPAIVIGVGRVGLAAMRQVRHHARTVFGEHPPTIRYLYIDTDPDTAAEALSGHEPLEARDVILTRLNRPAYYLQREGMPPVDAWLPPGALYRLPRTTGPTSGVRAFGRLALFDHVKSVAQRIQQELEPFLSDDVLHTCAGQTGLGVRTNQPRVYLLAGLAGGTGSGMFIDLAYLVKHILRQHGYYHPDVAGILFAPPADATVPRGPHLANSYASLTELHHFLSGNRYQARYDTAEAPIGDSTGPFGRCLIFQLPAVANDREMNRTTGMAACGMLWEMATPMGRTIDQVREMAATLPRAAGPTVQTFGLYRYVWPRAQLLTVTTGRFARSMMLRWAGKESAHLKEPIRAWLAEQWTKRSLDIADVIEKFNQAVKDSLREEPEAVFEAIVQPLLARSAGPGRVDAHAAAEILDQILKLVGKPPTENDRAGSLHGVLDEYSKTLVKKADRHLATLAVSFIEQTQYRLAGADEALAQISDKLKTQIDALQGVRNTVDQEVRESYSRVFPLIGGLGNTLGIGGRRGGLTSELVDQLRNYPRARLRLLVLDTALSFYRGLEGNCPEYSRDVQTCRTRIEEFVAKFEATSVASHRASGYESFLLPPGCKGLREVADEFIAALPPEDILGFERLMQDEITERFKALVNVCMKPMDGQAFVESLRENAAAFLNRRLESVDPAELFFRYKADDAKTPEVLAAAFDGAGPDLTTISGKAPAEATVLATPTSPAGDSFRQYVGEQFPEIQFIPAALSSEIAFFREYPVLPLAGLPQLAAHAKSAFDLQAANATPHCRVDLDWQTPATPPV